MVSTYRIPLAGMGPPSQYTTPYKLPDATAPSLTLAHPTDDEKRRTWTLNYKEWGGVLTLEEYLKREQFLATIPLSRDNGMTHWILTDSAWIPTDEKDTRPILATCETIQKPIAFKTPNDISNHAQSAIGHGIGSVFTYPEMRGHGYAGRMLEELGTTLREWKSREGHSGKIKCSALWSDIGKTYYAKKGWVAFPSRHVEFPVSVNQQPPPQQGSEEEEEEEAQPITHRRLADLCDEDGASLLDKEIVARAASTNRTAMAFSPNFDTMLWHLYRDEFIASMLFQTPEPTPDTQLPLPHQGAECSAGATDEKVWALWSRNYHPNNSRIPSENTDKNTLYILRVAVHAGSGGGGEHPSDSVVKAFAAVMRAALRQARLWHLGKIELWNPSPTVRILVERSGLLHRWVDRQEDSIPSLMWYGDEESGRVEWVANEKYCWC